LRLARQRGNERLGRVEDRITYTIQQPMRAIGISALVYGEPTSGIGTQQYVNHASWPSGHAPMARGFWRLDRYQTDYARYSGYYTLDAQASSKVVEDWSETGTLRDSQTGRYVKYSPAELTTLLSTPYAYGIVQGNGIQRVGFYPVINFATIFGF
jgi:hypothetical protein